MSADNQKSLWYKEPWSLCMVAIIATTICWCAISLYKVTQQRDFPIVNNYYTEGQDINQNLQQLNNALTKQISATFVIDQLLQEVQLTLTGKIDNWPETLTLDLTSNIHINYDISCKLHKINTGTVANYAKYSGQINKLMPGIYSVNLQDPINKQADSWKLQTKTKLDTGIIINF